MKSYPRTISPGQPPAVVPASAHSEAEGYSPEDMAAILKAFASPPPCSGKSNPDWQPHEINGVSPG